MKTLKRKMTRKIYKTKNCSWAEIKDTLETTDNPFEGNESIFLSTDSRTTERRKGKKCKSRFKIGEHENPEIQAAVDKCLAVNILYYSSQI